MKEKLAEQFGSDEAFGLYFELDTGGQMSVAEFDAKFAGCTVEEVPGTQSFLADGGSGTCCTDYAAFIYKSLPGRVRIYGFANEDNPGCVIVQEEMHPGGHDFAVVDDRYLVDPWVRLVVGEDWPIVYDFQDVQDIETALHRYGPRANWQRMAEAERFADKDASFFRKAA